MALLILFIILRLGIFGWSRKRITNKQYDKPVSLKYFILRKNEVPKGWSLSPGELDRPNPQEATANETMKSLPEACRPQLKAVGQAIAANYSHDQFGKAYIATFVLATPAEAISAVSIAGEAASSAKWELRSFAFDDRLVLALVPKGRSPIEFLGPLRKKVDAKKTYLRKIEKLKVIGNTLIKILIDLLVFGFVFIVILYVTKFVFITRKVEGS